MVHVAELVARAHEDVRVLLRPPDHQGARSWLADGRCVVWRPVEPPATLRYAVDAELADQPVPPYLARRHGIADAETFWRLWTAMEVRSKLAHVPVAVWLRARGLAARADVDVITFSMSSIVISCGTAR